MTQEDISNFFKDKSVLITGGLGSVGSAIVKLLLKYPVKAVRIMDNRETEMFYMKKSNTDPRVSFCFADVQHKDSVRRGMSGIDIVLHAAAMKHVAICELHPADAIRTNVVGTNNMIDLSMEYGVEKMILISTDKAVNPEGVMGATKMLAERMISATHAMDVKSPTKFGAVRFGNVLYSRGSVLEIWDELLRRGEKITVTNPDMTRFIMRIPQSVELVLSAVRHIGGSEVFILKMPSCTIGTLAEAYLETKGLSSDHCTYIGMMDGDKMHEGLISSDEVDFLLENEKFFVKAPFGLSDKQQEGIPEYYKGLGFERSQKKFFTSNDQNFMLQKDAVKKILQELESA